MDGVYKSTLTNESTGDSIPIHIPGKLTIQFDADGSSIWEGSGHTLVWHTLDQADEFRTGIRPVLGSRHVTEVYDAGFNLLEATYTGRVTDLCAALAG